MFLFLAALFFLQGIPVGAGQGGIVSGVLRGTDGKPLPYVRVAAVAPLETIDDRSSAAMAGLAETDEQGRYSIEGIPQGRYYIAAGRVDFPTYYPGTPEMKTAVVLSVMPGSTISGIDFVMDDSSTRVQQGLGAPLPVYAVIPVQVSLTGGGKIPLFSNGQVIRLQLTNGNPFSTIAVPLTTISFSLQSQEEYDVRVDGLPQEYLVQSITYGSVDLKTTRMKVPAVRSSGTTVGPPISIVLRALTPTPSASGARVSGRMGKNSVQSVYLSGVPGTLYADGTFEFRGVPPGKHVLAGLAPTSALGALVVVGDRDVTGIELRDDVLPLPFNMRAPRDPEPAGTGLPGSVVPLASVRGIILETTTKKPIADSEIKITGYAKTETFIIDANGRFQIPRLFPGTYRIDVEVFGHENVSQTITVGTENITLDLTSRRLY